MIATKVEDTISRKCIRISPLIKWKCIYYLNCYDTR